MQVSQIIYGQSVEYSFDCEKVECADGYEFLRLPEPYYCGCFPPYIQNLVPSLPFFNPLQPQIVPTNAPTSMPPSTPQSPEGVPEGEVPLGEVPEGEVPDTPTPPTQITLPVTNMPTPQILPITTPLTMTNELPPPPPEVPDPIPQPEITSNGSIVCMGQSIICSEGGVFDVNTCQCVCIQQQQCQFSFQVFNPSTCRCEPQDCPNTCSQCEIQNHATCACQAIKNCPDGKILDSQTCQCVCINSIHCNRLQRLNQNTCQCECILFTTITPEVITRLNSNSARPIVNGNILQTTSPHVTTRNDIQDHSARSRRKHRPHRHRGKRHITEEERNDIALSRMKRRKSRSRSDSRSLSINSNTSVQPTQPSFRTIIINVATQVSACPVGKIPVQSTCRCM